MGRSDEAAARRGSWRRRGFRVPRLLVVLLVLAWHPSWADEPVSIKVGYLRWTERQATISLIDQKTADAGLAGAKIAIADNNTTGRITGQDFALVDSPLRADDDPVAALAALVGQGVRLVMTDAPAETVLKLADAGRADGVTLFNIDSPDDRLRGEDCRANVVHVAPSRMMLADALAQYLVVKKWPRWLLMVGSHPEDVALGDAYARSAKRYGARVVERRTFADTGGSRQTDTGLTQTAQEMALATQGAPEHDVTIAADEHEVFAGYLPYRTWDPRPVAGSAGLEPVTWDPASDSWGGAQLQVRFSRLNHRPMRALDMQAWTAARMVGEGASRTNSGDPKVIADFIRGPDFRVAAYKGQELTLRPWDLQLRQPILLSDGRVVVSVSPQAGFLHQVTELDTLGIDRPETKCTLK